MDGVTLGSREWAGGGGAAAPEASDHRVHDCSSVFVSANVLRGQAERKHVSVFEVGRFICAWP